MYCFGPFSDQLPERKTGRNTEFSDDGETNPKIPISDSYMDNREVKSEEICIKYMDQTPMYKMIHQTFLNKTYILPKKLKLNMHPFVQALTRQTHACNIFV